MAVRAEAFTGTVQLAPADPDNEILGLASKGFTSVTVYNGTSNTGAVVARLTGEGTISLNWPVTCDKGVYVEVAGTGSGSVYF